MTRPLGQKQRDLLCVLGRVGHSLVVADKIAKSLCARGLAKAWGEENDSFIHITPGGLRQLADEMETGRVPDGNLDYFKSIAAPIEKGLV